jgi:hypothetical protein
MMHRSAAFIAALAVGDSAPAVSMMQRVTPLLARVASAVASLAGATASTGTSASPRVFDHLTSDCCGSRSMMNTRSPASMAVTASDEASVLLPEPPFCVTNAMVRMFIPSDGFWKW